MPSFNFGSTPDRVTAMDLVVRRFEDMQEAFEEVLYPDILWRETILQESVDTSIDPGADTKSYGVKDWKGRGAFRGRLDTQVPTVARTLDKSVIPIQVAGVTAIFDREDARKIQMGYNDNLMTELTETMKKACENHVEGTVFYGNENYDFQPYLDYPNVPTSTAANGNAGTATWTTKTADEILFDMNNALTSVWDGSSTVHLPDMIELPAAQYGLIATMRLTNEKVSVLEYIKMNNVMTAQTGRPLEIKVLRYLNGAGAGATDRMIVKEQMGRNVKLPFSIPYELLEPQLDGYGVILLAEYKFGSFHMPYPLSMGYTDGI